MSVLTERGRGGRTGSHDACELGVPHSCQGQLGRKEHPLVTEVSHHANEDLTAELRDLIKPFRGVTITQRLAL
jgi:hypothetical protein